MNDDVKSGGKWLGDGALIGGERGALVPSSAGTTGKRRAAPMGRKGQRGPGAGGRERRRPRKRAAGQPREYASKFTL